MSPTLKSQLKLCWSAVDPAKSENRMNILPSVNVRDIDLNLIWYNTVCLRFISKTQLKCDLLRSTVKTTTKMFFCWLKSERKQCLEGHYSSSRNKLKTYCQRSRGTQPIHEVLLTDPPESQQVASVWEGRKGESRTSRALWNWLQKPPWIRNSQHPWGDLIIWEEEVHCLDFSCPTPMTACLSANDVTSARCQILDFSFV